MRSLTKLAAFAALLTLAAGVFAQGRGGGRFGMQGRGGGAMLLGRKDVQADLKLTDDQKTKITDLLSKMREEMQNARDNASASGDGQSGFEAMRKIGDDYKPKFDAILTPDQQARLKQIGIQLRKNMALQDPEVQNDLGLSADQKSKIEDLMTKYQDANREIFQKIQNGELDRDQAAPIRKKNTDTLNDDLMKILTPDQVDKFKAMQGPPFVSTEPDRGFGGRGPGGRGGH